MLDGTPAPLQLVICGNELDAAAIRATGLRSVRVVKAAEDLYRPTHDGYELDSSLAIFGSFVVA